MQELLLDYDGTVLLVSHDRDFLDRVVTSVLASEGEGRWLNYAGGYTDMMAQRRLAAKEEKRQQQKSGGEARSGRLSAGGKTGGQGGGAQPTAGRDPASNRARGKLSYKDKYALETLPGEIRKLEGEIAALEQILANPDLYAQNPEKFQKTIKALDAARQTHTQHEDNWLRLELLKEELEG